MIDLMIIGAGTAGLTAAIYGVRAGLTVEVIEQTVYGGQIITSSSVENYPGMPGISGADFAIALYEQATKLGAKVRFETLTKAELGAQPKKLHFGDRVEEARSVIIATGAKPKKLSVSGEESYMGAGVSYCATCDGHFYKGKDVAVIGGGNTAIEEALVLSGLANKVYLIHRREEFRADYHDVEKLRQRDNVEWLTQTVVKEITGKGSVDGVVLKNAADGTERSVAVDGVFVAIGAEPDNRIFAEQLALDDYGYVVADESCETNLEGVFVAGDTRTKKVRQIITAAADGAVAALAANEYLSDLANEKGTKA